MWFKRKPVTRPVDPVVEDIKKQTHSAANKATQSANRLNKLFEKNGITLNIHTAVGGKSGH